MTKPIEPDVPARIGDRDQRSLPGECVRREAHHLERVRGADRVPPQTRDPPLESNGGLARVVPPPRRTTRVRRRRPRCAGGALRGRRPGVGQAPPPGDSHSGPRPRAARAPAVGRPRPRAVARSTCRHDRPTPVADSGRGTGRASRRGSRPRQCDRPCQSGRSPTGTQPRLASSRRTWWPTRAAILLAASCRRSCSQMWRQAGPNA